MKVCIVIHSSYIRYIRAITTVTTLLQITKGKMMLSAAFEAFNFWRSTFGKMRSF